MNTWLLILTALALLVAGVAAAIAWRVVRADRRRSAARVAVLAAAARVSAVPPAAWADVALDDTPVEVPSGLHEFMPVRAASSPQLVGPFGVDAPAASPERGRTAEPSTAAPTGRRQRGLVAATAVFAFVAAAGAGLLFVSGRTPGVGAMRPRPPLELLALGHARTSGVLSVQGVVRNPPHGVPVDQLDAEVRVFDAAGLVIATRSARIEARSLAPGQDAPFAVSVGDAPAAARYRVSFTADGSMLPHVDRRSTRPAAVTADAR